MTEYLVQTAVRVVANSHGEALLVAKRAIHKDFCDTTVTPEGYPADDELLALWNRTAKYEE